MKIVDIRRSKEHDLLIDTLQFHSNLLCSSYSKFIDDEEDASETSRDSLLAMIGSINFAAYIVAGSGMMFEIPDEHYFNLIDVIEYRIDFLESDNPNIKSLTRERLINLLKDIKA